MSTPSLGYCVPDSDTFSWGSTGAVGDASWTPDGSGGGTLSVSVPGDPGCTGGDPTPVGVSGSLILVRSQRGKIYTFEVSGTVGSLATSQEVTVRDQSGTAILTMAPLYVEFCGPAQALEVQSGDNPVSATPGCSCGGFFQVIFGTGNEYSEAYSFTVVVTAS